MATEANREEVVSEDSVPIVVDEEQVEYVTDVAHEYVKGVGYEVAHEVGPKGEYITEVHEYVPEQQSVEMVFKNEDYQDSNNVYGEKIIYPEVEYVVKEEYPGQYMEEEYYYQESYDQPITYQIRTHTGRKPFHCNTCNTHVDPNDHHHLKHTRSLSADRPVVRHVYYMNFTRRSTPEAAPSSATSEKLGKRRRGKKTYPCDKCGKVFWHKSHYDNHMRMHTGERPFQCSQCDRKFGQKSNLKTHFKKHLVDSKSSKKLLKNTSPIDTHGKTSNVKKELHSEKEIRDNTEKEVNCRSYDKGESSLAKIKKEVLESTVILEEQVDNSIETCRDASEFDEEPLPEGSLISIQESSDDSKNTLKK